MIKIETAFRNSIYGTCILVMCLATIVMFGLSELARVTSRGASFASEGIQAAASHCKAYLDAMVFEYKRGARDPDQVSLGIGASTESTICQQITRKS